MEKTRIELKRAHNRIVTMLDQEREKIVHIYDVDVLNSEWGCTIQNNIDILESALRDVDGVLLTLSSYEEV